MTDIHMSHDLNHEDSEVLGWRLILAAVQDDVNLRYALYEEIGACTYCWMGINIMLAHRLAEIYQKDLGEKAAAAVEEMLETMQAVAAADRDQFSLFDPAGT